MPIYSTYIFTPYFKVFFKKKKTKQQQPFFHYCKYLIKFCYAKVKNLLREQHFLGAFDNSFWIISSAFYLPRRIFKNENKISGKLLNKIRFLYLVGQLYEL